MSNKNIAVFACGGAGINIVAGLSRIFRRDEVGFASITPYYVDTSKSNLHDPAFDKENVYLVEGVDGSAKIRAMNYELIAERSKEIVHQFKPSDLNIVVHSASGGSGSVIAPVIVDEMLAMGKPVIVMMVGTTDSGKEIENTSKTLQTYELISKEHGKPVVAMYCENSAETPRGKVDANIHSMIALLSVVFSGQNRELDTADTTNFLDYTKATGYQASLTRLDVFSEIIELGKNQNAISVLTISDDNTPTRPNVAVEYQAVGYLPENINPEAMNFKLPVHFVTISGGFNDVVTGLQKEHKAIIEVRNASINKSIVDASVKPVKGKMVL